MNLCGKNKFKQVQCSVAVSHQVLSHMRRTVKYIFRSQALVTDITGNIPGWCMHRLPYAQAERTVIREGTIISQYYSHFLFFIEVVEIDLHTDLEADYLTYETSLFLFMMLEGNIAFYTTGGEQVAEAGRNTCYATYNRNGKFSFCLPAGKHRLCYIAPRDEWVAKNIQYYPRLGHFLKSMQTGDALFGHMPTCEMGKGMETALIKLLGREERKGKDLESVLLRDAKRVIYHYQKLLDTKFAQRVYLIKDYMDKNYANPNLTNAVLMEVFHITEKTLIASFRDDFKITPHRYLIKLRMQEAKRLLKEEKKVPSEASLLVGYGNFRSFRAQFRKFYGFPPSACH